MGVDLLIGFAMGTCFRACNCLSRSLDRFSVDIDRASFGHQVVEIEQMSSPKMADIESARDSIAALARSLGAQREGASGRSVQVGGPSKVFFFFFLYRYKYFSCENGETSQNSTLRAEGHVSSRAL